MILVTGGLGMIGARRGRDRARSGRPSVSAEQPLSPSRGERAPPAESALRRRQDNGDVIDEAELPSV